MKLTSTTRPTRPVAGRILALAAISLAAYMAGGGTALAQFAPNPCSCYYDFECKATGRGDYCSYVGDCWGNTGCNCIIKPDVKLPTVPPFDQQFPNGVLICAGPAGQPKCDGVCKFNRPNTASYENAKPELVARAMELVLDAYIKAGSESGGFPDPDLLNKARAVAGTLNQAWQKEILNAVHDIMLTLLGGDFLAPQGENMFGQIPKLSDEQKLLLESVAEEVVEAILTGNPDAVKDVIFDFWANNFFEPLHPDHCFDHGHTQAQPVDICMAGQISGLLAVFVRGQDMPCDPESPGCQDPPCDPGDPDCNEEPPPCDPSNPDCDRSCDPEVENCETLDGRNRPVTINSVTDREGKVISGRRTRRVPWTTDPGGRARDRD